MNPEEIRQQIKVIIANVTGISPQEIPDNASFQDDLDLDSLSLLEVGVDVDYTFKLGLPEEELQGLQALDDVVNLVLEHSGAELAAAVA